MERIQALNNCAVFCRLIARQKGGNYSRETIMSNNCLLEDGSKYFFYYYPIKSKLISSNTLNMGFLSVPNLFP